MTISRTNYCTNPSCATTAGYNINAGGGTVTGSIVGGAYTATCTANCTADAGINALTTLIPMNIAVGNQFTTSTWVVSSRNQIVNFGSYLKDNSGAQIAGTNNGGYFTLTAGQALRVSATTLASPSAAATGSVYFYCYTSVSHGGSLMVSGDTLGVDGTQCERGAFMTSYFTGGTATTTNKTYAWTGTANASASTESIGLPTTTCQAMVDAPCPRVGVTVDGLGSGNTVYNLWRTADGKRSAVRGARNRSTVDSDYVIDYEAPLGRPIIYDIEVVSGTNYLAATFPDTATVTSTTWWIQDPLVPSSAIPLAVNHQDPTVPCLTAAAVKALEYSADVTIIPILGSPEPVALMGGRQLAGNVDFSMFTRAAEATTTLRNLIQQTPLLLVRTNGVRNDGVPGLAYFVSAKPVEQPVTVAFGGTLTNWQLQGDLVAAPSLNVLVPIWTYGAVQALWATYQQAQTTLAGKLYLDVLKSPTGV